jgi:hypothetical protein
MHKRTAVTSPAEIRAPLIVHPPYRIVVPVSKVSVLPRCQIVAPASKASVLPRSQIVAPASKASVLPTCLQTVHPHCRTGLAAKRALALEIENVKILE